MDLSIIEAIHPVTILNPPSARNNFNQNLYVPFVPDFVIVKSITYSSRIADLNIAGGDYNKFVNISTNLINDSASIGSFDVHTSTYDGIADYGTSSTWHNVPLLFKLNKQVQGSYNFSFRDASNNSTTLNGDIAIHLEFIKVKVDKQQKFY